ncbi:aldo/keto reductase [Sphingobacterium sp. SRCM116780]|uniref:aldo/keto reductase n=1 Tax=Sphingobacterium sp. SRCM116780 TaxID=2907623 RepID=UPI001F22F2A0|nr:aldo/keto reductase [Sphingobacterium sp. SRCM116780]UIR57595.1 aldo/keto reductase [Sphingobacterium sp. SRCM116780]
MIYRTLGNTNEQISAIGLGCMGMSFAYGPSDEGQSIATLEKALEIGLNFWDTADMYGNGANEELIAKVLVPNRDKVFIATKFGFRFKNGIAAPSNSLETYFDGSPKWIKSAVEHSLRRLKVDVIDLYYAHRVDPNVPIEETVGAMSDLVKEGKVKYLGLSEASPESIRKAHKIHPISALQNEYSILSRDVEKEVLKTTRELGISLVCYSPLSRGLVTNTLQVDKLDDNDFRKMLPRYQGSNLANNNQLAHVFAAFAQSKNMTAAQLALAWLLHQGDDVIPIPGTRSEKRLIENAGAIDFKLNEQELKEIEDILKKYPHIGERYTEAQYGLVNN